MRELDQELQRVVGNLKSQVMTFYQKKSRVVKNHLQELLSHLIILEEQQRNESEHLQITYDLLVICASKIENEYQSQSWIVDQLLIQMDKRVIQEAMPQRVKRMHPFRRGLVKNHGLSVCEQVELVQEAYDRAKALFFNDYVVPIDQKLKMTFGNIFSGMMNLGVLFEIHPIFTQLMLPIGPLRNQFETFINRLVTDLLVEPKLNHRVSVLTSKNIYSDRPGLNVDFYGILTFLSIASDAKLSMAAGRTEDSQDVRLIRSVTDLLRQARVIFLQGDPCRAQIALQGQDILREVLIKLLSAVIKLKSFYSWGGALDDALNDFIVELKGFCEECLIVLRRPVTQMIPNRSAWNLIGLWAGTGSVLNSTMNTLSEFYTGFLPRVYHLFKFMLPREQLTGFITNCRPALEGAIKHGDALIKGLQLLGIYHATTQKAIVPLRGKFLAINLEPLQRIIAIYHSHFEQFVQDLPAAKNTWMKLGEEGRCEILLNLAALLHHLNAFLPFIFAFLEPELLSRTRAAFAEGSEEQSHFDGMVDSLSKLQNVLKKGSAPVMKSVMDLLESTGNQVTAGQAASSLVSSKGFFGSMMSGVVDSLTGARLDLSYHPTCAGVSSIPARWQEHTIKEILRMELEHTFQFVRLFNELDFNSVHPVQTPAQVSVAIV